MNTDLGPIAARLQDDLRQTAEKQAPTLEHINDALQRLDNGEFGYCERCSAPIALSRLMKNPAARYCTNCVPDE